VVYWEKFELHSILSLPFFEAFFQDYLCLSLNISLLGLCQMHLVRKSTEQVKFYPKNNYDLYFIALISFRYIGVKA